MKYLLFLSLLILNISFSQEGTVSSTLLDENNIPLPGATILVKGTTTGTSTDFDGNYSIKCSIGDILVISYVGYSNREILVTPEMFGENNGTSYKITPKKPVEKIKSKAYKEALKKDSLNLNFIPSVNTSEHTYKSNEFNRIKEINIDSTNVFFTYFKPDLFFEAGIDNTSYYRFVKNNNLFQTQSTYVQGRPVGNNLTHIGPENNEVFSFGPSIHSLSFNSAITNNYDTNGTLEPSSVNNASPYNNKVLTTSLAVKNRAYFQVFNNKNMYQLNLTHNTNKDLFNQERNNLFGGDFNFRTKDKKIDWNFITSFNQTKDYLTNTNGLQNKILLSNYITPISFQNNQGNRLNDGSQRSFSPMNYNNPLWLIKNNQNYNSINSFRTSLENDFSLKKRKSLKTIIGYTYNKDKQFFWLPEQTIGFTNEKNTQKIFKTQLLYLNTEFEYWDIINSGKFDMDFTSSFSINKDLLSYKFQNIGLQQFINRSLNKTTTNFQNKLELEYDYHSSLIIQNNTFYSSIQEDKRLQPTVQLKLNSRSFFNLYGDFLSKALLSFRYSNTYSDSPLYYKNKSHNSLLIGPDQFQEYTENYDLFIDKSLALENTESIEIGSSVELFNDRLNLGFNFFRENHNNSIFPIINGSSFQLENVGNIVNKGLEAKIEGRIYKRNNFSYKGSVIFYKNRTEVTKLNNNQSIVPIAGFTTTSGNLIEGQPAGILVGSSYLRDNDNNIIIGNDGFPLVNPNRQIIGDPTPDFTIGFSNAFEFKKWSLDFTIDAQKGGDVWNGSQNVLNYHGVSKETADLRNTNNFVFNGVQSNGSINTVPVAFASPNNSVIENRWVRYGFEGVAEEAIEDGSYINLKSISLSYKIDSFTSKNSIKELKISLFAENLFTLSKFKGASPYSNLFDHTSAIGLNLLNNPLVSSIGLQINVKI